MAGVSILVAFFAAIALMAVGGGQADASGRQGNQPADLANCFAFSIDQAGRGNLDGSIEKFDDCLADDYSFSFSFFEGADPIVCPGEGCPIQEFDSLGDLRARFAYSFFQDAGYLATQHQMLNVDVTRHGNQAEVFAYIQANHFLPDNSVDIAWNDFTIQTERQKGKWVITDEVIVGTAFLNFKGGPPGGGGDAGGPLAEGTDVTLRNTLQDPGEPEATYASLFGQPDDAFDEFGAVSNSDVEFPTALAQAGTPVGDINGLYSIDFTENTINFEVVAAADDPFWTNVFGLFPDGKFDRYYFTFAEPHGITGFTSDNPNLNVRIDSDTVIVVEFSGGYDLQSGVTSSVELS